MRPERAADHSPPSSAVVMERQSYTSTRPLGHTGPVTGNTLPSYMKIVYGLNIGVVFKRRVQTAGHSRRNELV